MPVVSVVPVDVLTGILLIKLESYEMTGDTISKLHRGRPVEWTPERLVAIGEDFIKWMNENDDNLFFFHLPFSKLILEN